MHDQLGLSCVARTSDLLFSDKLGHNEANLLNTSYFKLLDWLKSRVNPRTSWIGYLCASGIVLASAIALLDPSASLGLNFFDRLAFWLLHTGVAIMLLEAVQIVLGRFRMFAKLSPIRLVFLGALVGALTFSLISLFLLEPLLHFPDLEIGGDLFNFGEFIDEALSSGGQLVLLWMLLNTPRLIIIKEDQKFRERQILEDDLQKNFSNTEGENLDLQFYLLEFSRKLPQRLGSDIVALTAELHYLRVYTTHGDALILMPFSRAVKALQGVSGLIVHRSHWVSKKHVIKISHQGSRVFCELTTGLRVPISRPYRTQVSKAISENKFRNLENLVRQISVE